VINAYIDVVWDATTHKVHVEVACRLVKYCSFSMAEVPVSDDPASIFLVAARNLSFRVLGITHIGSANKL
jgi:hypothetical protein